MNAINNQSMEIAGQPFQAELTSVQGTNSRGKKTSFFVKIIEAIIVIVGVIFFMPIAFFIGCIFAVTVGGTEASGLPLIIGWVLFTCIALLAIGSGIYSIIKIFKQK